LRVGKASLLRWWPVSILVLVVASIGMSKIAFTQESVSEHLWLLYYDIPHAPVIKEVRLPIVLLFLLCCMTFIPLGQFVAERLKVFRDAGASLWGYSFDLLGSLVGVLAFAAASFLRSFPVVWFAALLLAGLYLFRRSRHFNFAICLMACCLFLVWKFEKAAFYSPYYALSISHNDVSDGRYILTNGSLHQYAAPIALNLPITKEYDRTIRYGYHTPYRLLQQTPKRVLILGAGSGNDVQVALDEGVEQIDAVEIDPVIQQLGQTVHPTKPYLSPRVRAINTDAREFLNKSTDKYDLIVFGTLDSMTRLSALSGVRLDNFVYTVDCMKAARAHLTPTGGVVLYFAVGARYIDLHLTKMLYEAFGELPVSQIKHYQLFNTVFAAGPAFAHILAKQDPRVMADTIKTVSDVEAPTDDWPFLYLQGRGVSTFYLTLIGAFVLISIVGVGVASPEMFRFRGKPLGGIDAEMFLFGLAFLLLETKSVTEMNLVWGVTWVTSAVVFGSILLTLLLSTVLMQVRSLPAWLCGGGLMVSLLISYFVPTHALLGHDLPATLLLSCGLIGLPIFFASTCFALRFKTRAAVDLAFGWNLIGAVAGGLLEFSSMAIGFRNLALVALVAYVGAFVIAWAMREPAAVGEETAQPEVATSAA